MAEYKSEFTGAQIDDGIKKARSALQPTGATMTGPLILSGDPIAVKEAVTKQYVDNTYNGIIEEVAALGQVKPEFANSIEECTDTKKVYVLPDGYLYAYMYIQDNLPEITISGEAGGYYAGDEWNPTGKLQANASCSAKRTNLIPVTPGDILNYKGYGADAVYSVFWLDSSNALLNREQINSTGGYTAVTVPDGAAYVWFASFAYANTTDSVVLDVQWVTCQGSSPGYHWTNTGHAFVTSDHVDVLDGKKIVYDGDSICMGYNADGGYPAMIAEYTNGTYENQAVGGGLLTASSTVHSVVNNLANLPTDGDIYCFQGGINDYWGGVALGTCTQGDYTGTLDTSTICGALETIFRYALSNFVGKGICFVITHKIQNTAYQNNSAGHSFKDYRDAMVQVCEKYSIPYYDAFSASGLNGWNDAQNNSFLTANGAGSPDGTHPNIEGYKRYYVPQLCSLFRTIVIGSGSGGGISESYILPTASETIKGGVKVGNGLQMDGDVLSVKQGEYELIETITITEDMVIERTAEPDGTPYSFDALNIHILIPNGLAAPKGSILFYKTNDLNAHFIHRWLATKTITEALAWEGKVYNHKGLYEYVLPDVWDRDGGSPQLLASVRTNPNHFTADYPIGKVNITMILPAGTIITIKGVRANA